MYVFGVAFLCNVAFLQAAPLARHMVDMTYTYDETTLRWPGNKAFKLDVVMNGTTEKGFWLQSEEFSSAIHLGTHMDAPAHFSKGGLTVDQLEVSDFIAPAAVVDITAKAADDVDAEVTVEDLMHWEGITGQSLNGTVLLMNTGWGAKWHNQTAFFGTDTNDASQLHFPGLSGEAARWLVDHRHILGIGTDTLSFDRGNSVDYAAHITLLGAGIYGLENVANIDQLPLFGATLYVMPMKIQNASGAPTRIIATFPEVIGVPAKEL